MMKLLEMATELMVGHSTPKVQGFVDHGGLHGCFGPAAMIGDPVVIMHLGFHGHVCLRSSLQMRAYLSSLRPMTLKAEPTNTELSSA